MGNGRPQGGSGVGFNAAAPGFGEALQANAAKESVQTLLVLGYGVQAFFPCFENYVELDPEVRDSFLPGIPVSTKRLQLGVTTSETRERCGRASSGNARSGRHERCQNAFGDSSAERRTANHDVGTARMGSDPENQF